MDRSARFPLAFSVLTLLCLTAPALLAQTATPPAAGDTAPAEPKKRTRVVSNEVAAALAAGMPKYDPPKPVEPKAEEDLPDLRESDKPRNGIIRLPDYVVREKKPPVFNQADVRDKQNFALHRFAGLNLSGGNNRIARDLLWEEERLTSKAEFTDLARTGSVNDPESQRYYKKLLNDTYVLPSSAVNSSTSSSWPSASERANGRDR